MQYLPAPTNSAIPLRPADFATLTEGLDYAASGRSGLTFFDRRAQAIKCLPYSDLRDAALALARRLLAQGLQPGDRVGLIATTDPSFIQSFFACQYAGLIPATLPLPLAFGSPRHYVATLRRMLESIEARAVFVSGPLEDFARQAAIGTAIGLAGCPAKLAPAAASALPQILPSDISYLQFSSGSTRAPMAVAIEHRALLSNARGIIRDALKIGSGDRAVSWLPLYHDMGLVGFLLTPVLCQISVDLLSTADFSRQPLVWPRVLSDHGGTLSYSPSFGYELCAKRAGATADQRFDLSRWRVAGIGGDIIRPHILEEFTAKFTAHGFNSRAFVASYGMAETTLAISFAPLGRGLECRTIDMDRLESTNLAAAPMPATRRVRRFAVCGAPMPGHDIEIRNEHGSRLLAERVGRIFVRGPSLMRGYWGAPPISAPTEDRWLDTGDLGFRSGNQLIITGRIKDLIVINGRNLLPQDLEWSAEQTSGLRSGDAAAFSIDSEDQERVVVLVQCRSLEREQREEIRESVRAAIRARHGIIVDVVLMPPRSLPKTSSGKLRRSRARALYLSGEIGEAVQTEAELRCAVP
jgi:fatty-acyl-CoA synthase